MITRKAWVDGENATYKKAFYRSKGWDGPCREAAIWLWGVTKAEFPGQHLFAFITPPSPVEDNRINRYRRTKSPFLREICSEGSAIVKEGEVSSADGVLFWFVLMASQESLGTIIDYVRTQRGCFLFVANDDFYKSELFLDIINDRNDGKLSRIDQEETIDSLVKYNIKPVRIAGQFDDLHLWVEIYDDAFKIDDNP
jgi:hypothetical protein